VAKGGNFEREIAKLLSLWWSEGARDDIFYRSHASGGRFTMRRKTGKDTALQGGDVTASDPIGEPLVKEWSIEIKTGYGKKTDTGINRWDILDFLDSRQKEPVLQKMWNQCTRDAELTNRNPVLIFRRNGRTPCIMFTTHYMLTKLQPFYGNIKKHRLIIKTTLDCVIMSLQDFFEWIPSIKGALCSNQSVSTTSSPTKKRISRYPKV
jgi:hypothetical protein